MGAEQSAKGKSWAEYTGVSQGGKPGQYSAIIVFFPALTNTFMSVTAALVKKIFFWTWNTWAAVSGWFL